MCLISLIGGIWLSVAEEIVFKADTLSNIYANPLG